MAGKVLVTSHWIFLEKLWAISIVRSASFQISKDNKVSKSFFVLPGIAGLFKFIHTGICSHGGRSVFNCSFVIVISFSISMVFSELPHFDVR
jgi:hypothetical protein